MVTLIVMELVEVSKRARELDEDLIRIVSEGRLALLLDHHYWKAEMPMKRNENAPRIYNCDQERQEDLKGCCARANLRRMRGVMLS